VLPSVERVIIDSTRKPYIPKVIIYHNIDYIPNEETFLNFLEEKRIFAICFDTTPPNLIGKVSTYDKLSKYNSDRLLSCAIYIGDLEISEYEAAIDRILRGMFEGDYEVYDREKEYTRLT